MTPTRKRAVVTLKIDDTSMSGQPDHAATQLPDRGAWEVSRLPGQILDRNTAITAMTLADTPGERDIARPRTQRHQPPARTSQPAVRPRSR